MNVGVDKIFSRQLLHHPVFVDDIVSRTSLHWNDSNAFACAQSFGQYVRSVAWTAWSILFVNTYIIIIIMDVLPQCNVCIIMYTNTSCLQQTQNRKRTQSLVSVVLLCKLSRPVQLRIKYYRLYNIIYNVNAQSKQSV